MADETDRYTSELAQYINAVIVGSSRIDRVTSAEAAVYIRERLGWSPPHWQVIEGVPDEAVSPEVAELRGALKEEKAGRRVAGEAADRFRDVITEALGLDDNPGDDELVRQLRALHGKTGPEPRRWRDFLTGAVAHMENSGLRWRSDVAEEAGSD